MRSRKLDRKACLDMVRLFCSKLPISRSLRSLLSGISHVTVTFDGEGDSGQIESIAAWAGETAVAFPAVEIPYAAITWDSPEVEMRQLSLEDVVEQLAYDFLSDTHGGWENNDGAYGEFCFDAGARCIHLEFNERFTSSELFTHDF